MPRAFAPGWHLAGHCCLYPSPQTPTPLPHPPAPDFPISLRTSGKQVQENGGGVRVWVPTIPVGWDGAGFIPLASTPRTWDKLRRRRLRGGQNPWPKRVPNFNDDYDGADGDTSSPPWDPYRTKKKKRTRRISKTIVTKIIVYYICCVFRYFVLWRKQSI